MARLLLVTRSMALSLRLADAHDVVERPDDELDALTPDSDIDLVVLDVSGPQVAVETIEGMRARDIEIPVLVVSGYQPEWAEMLTLSMPQVGVVALPITRASLLDGIARLLDDDYAPPAPAPVPAPVPAPPPPRTAPEPRQRPAPRPEREPEPGPRPRPKPEPKPRPGPGPAPTDQPQDEPGRRFPLRRSSGRRDTEPPHPEPPAAPAAPAAGRMPGSPEPDLVLGDDYDPFFATAPQVLDDLQPDTRLRKPDTSLNDMVQLLIDRSAELYGVPDTAQVLADEIVERADADAAAVLIPDGAIWRVSAGVGLRPLERRLVLDSSHWLIAEAALQGRALLIEDTDIVRQKIAGAPLAAWKHLMCLPITILRSAVVVARGGEAGPFTERDLAAVIDPIREAAGLLDRALDVRRLARTLAPLRDTDDRRGR